MARSTRLAASSRRRRKEQRPGEIVEAALAEFSQRGFAATRLEDVAERAGVTKGTIYFYFKDKGELFRAAARGSIGPALDELAALRAGFKGSAADLLRAFLRVFYSKFVKNPRARQIFRLLIADGPQFPELIEFYHGEIISRGIGVLRAVIELGVARREFRRTAAIDFPQVVFGPAIAAVVWNLLLADRQPIDLDAYAHAHVDLILDGLKPR